MAGQQVAAGIATAGQQMAALVGGVSSKTMTNAFCGAALVWMLAAGGQLAAVFIPDGSLENSPDLLAVNPAANSKNLSSRPDIKQLQALNLFGVTGAQPKVQKAVVVTGVELNAAKTKLKLSLDGIAHSSVTEEAIAVIIYQGKQDQYHIGDKLPVGSKVLLAKILVDHVILDNSGSYESLWLYDEEKKGRAPVSARQNRSAAKQNKAAVGSVVKDYHKRLYKNPASLAEAFRISPAQVDGKMKGYRVSPGSDQKQFTQLGLKPGDVVTSINDISLDDPSKVLGVYKLMRTAKSANVTILRDGEEVQLELSLDQ